MKERSGLRMTVGPIVSEADGFSDDGGDTAELPRPAAPRPADDPLGAARLFARLRPALPVIAAVCVAPVLLFAGRVDDTVFIAPMLSELAGGFGLLLLPLMWAAYLALAALPAVFCLASVAGAALTRAAGGPAGAGAVVRLVRHRLRALWGWLTVLGVVGQVLPLLSAADVAGLPRVVLAVVAAGVAALTGLVGCVVLVERGRGPYRARRLLALLPGRVLAGLLTASAAMVVLPSLAPAAGGAWAVTAAGVVGTTAWAVVSFLTYVHARRLEGPVTVESLRRELGSA